MQQLFNKLTELKERTVNRHSITATFCVIGGCTSAAYFKNSVHALLGIGLGALVIARKQQSVNDTIKEQYDAASDEDLAKFEAYRAAEQALEEQQNNSSTTDSSKNFDLNS